MLSSLLFACIAISLAIYFHFRRKCEKKNAPPGPRGLPVVGHIPFLGRNPSMKFMQWKKIYGSIFSIRLGSIPAVVLNDVNLIKEAFKMDAFSGRPSFVNFTRVSKCKGLILTDGPMQTEQRNFVSKSFNNMGVGTSKLDFRIQDEISIFLNNLRTKCNNTEATKIQLRIEHFLQLPVINSLWGVITGHRLDESDPANGLFVKILKEIHDTNTSVVGQMCWFFPWCAVALDTFGLNQLVNGNHNLRNYIKKQIQRTKADYIRGQPLHFAHSYLDKVAMTTDPNSSFHESREQQPATFSDIFGAAIDTTTVTMDWVVLYMARAPSVQRKLQEEIDSVLGRFTSRTLPTSRDSKIEKPSLSHRPQMPYTEAVIYEILRISSIVPMGVFRRALEDVDFHGYKIPKDTLIIANQYGVHHDPEFWQEPEKFKPERFLDEEGNLNGLHKNLVPFGYGKRVCIGENFALDEIFVFTASIFQQFNISCTENYPSEEGIFGIVISPKPFEVVICERSNDDYSD